MKLPAQRREEGSATLVPTLWMTLGCFALLALTLQAQPGWWSGVLNGNPPTDYMVANQGQLKLFTMQAANTLNMTLTNNGGAGPDLGSLVYDWEEDYATNGYSTNTASPSYPYKPSDYEVVYQFAFLKSALVS